MAAVEIAERAQRVTGKFGYRNRVLARDTLIRRLFGDTFPLGPRGKAGGRDDFIIYKKRERPLDKAGAVWYDKKNSGRFHLMQMIDECPDALCVRG